MGACVQSRPSTYSPPRGIEKMKLENGYIVGKVRGVGGRPVGKKNYSRELDKTSRRKGDSNKSINISVVGSGGAGDEKGDKNIRREGNKEGGGGNASQRILLDKEAVGDELVDGWPKWLTDNIPREALVGLVPKSAESYDKLDKLEGLATSRMQYSLYLVFDFMLTDLSRIISRPDGRLTEPQVKCYTQQLLSGLQHCHERGILHRDIKGSNLLIDKDGMLKIADFGLANYFNPNEKRPLTSRVVTLWYRAPELLLGATDYGIGIDLWSAGCLMAEMFAGRPIMPGRTEVEQLHRIFKLCGSPSEDYWKKLKLPTSFQPPQPYKPSLLESFRDFPESSLGLLTVLLSLDPAYRGTTSSALQSEFFTTSPLACELSGLPVIYREEEPAHVEKIKNKASKTKRSRTQRERRKRDLSLENAKGDSGSSKETVETQFHQSQLQMTRLGCSGLLPRDTVQNSIPVVSSSNGTTGSLTLLLKWCGEVVQLNGEATIRTINSFEMSRFHTGSASSSVKPSVREENSPPPPFPGIISHRNDSPRTDGHPNATKNIKNMPPLPTTKTSTAKYKEGKRNINRSGLDRRSVSTRDFRQLEGQDFAKRYILDE
ncbi:hypothetical protein IFM89_038639 [Coptis chinensis]|uniref:Protein kinase domain-containing protein n=1 Tax=Coptis chinensis TaxID=261450 RepID=A0A835M0U8_9MAGN|nr:hypothetical protein IFM89_038639 [Coptis chinensis]